MGNRCCSSQSKTAKIYSTKALMNMQNFNYMDFYFSTENISRLEGECLVVFSDRKLKLKNTNMAMMMRKCESRKIKEEVIAYLDNNNISFDSMYETKPRKKISQNKPSKVQSSREDKQNSYILINIDLPNIKFTKVLLIFVQTWQGKNSMKSTLQKRIAEALQQVVNLGVKQIAVVQFDEELGIPVNFGAAILARSIFILSQKIKIATICLRNITDQLTFLSFFQNFKEQNTITSYSQKSVLESNYF